MNSLNAKSVFVCDSRHFFTRKSSQEYIEFDVISKNKPTGPPIIPMSPKSKSLWTSTVEAIQEYSRVVWDIFPSEKAICFVTFDGIREIKLNSWNDEEQNLNFFNSCFAKASMSAYLASNHASGGNENNAVLKGLQAAIEALCTPTKIQEERRKNKLNDVNKGRIILISYFKSDSQIKMIAEFILDAVKKCNQTILASFETEPNFRKLPLNDLNLVIINTHPIDESPKITELPFHEISSNISCEIISVKSGSYLASKLMSLVLTHYNLASTTVTGIPMKEEQNASSSANYDVELLHPSEAHIDLGDGLNICSIKEGTQYETVSLKWCTPRTSAVDLHYCSGAYRVTSVDVNSRPSSCLTHFLLNGRTVLLEMPKTKGTKVMSHMLSSHNGEIFIHTLGTGRSVLEDPPSISEGSGGRVTDYRITEFGALMKKNHLVRCKMLQVPGKEVIPPIDKCRLSLTRQTLYWPMIIGHTIIFNIAPQIPSLLSLIQKESLTIDDINECKKAIYQIVNMESKGTSLPVPSIASRGKGPKKEELYKLLWKELDHFLSVYATSDEHNAVLSCLRELHAKPQNVSENGTTSGPSSPPQSTSAASNEAKKTEVKDEVEMAWKELDAYNDMTEREKSDALSEPLHKKPKLSSKSPLLSTISNSDPQSLLTLWTKKLEEGYSRKRPEFAGRMIGTNIAPLYVNLNEKHDL